MNWESFHPLATIAGFHLLALLVYPRILKAIPTRPIVEPPADILFIVAGSALMLTSIFHLLTRSRAMGSTFLLPLAILCSTGLSFLFALYLAIALDIPIHPATLTFGLPFIISIVGFDKPLRIAHAVFYTRFACALQGHCPHHSPPAGSPIPIILFDSFLFVYPSIITNYFFEIKVLAIAAYLPFGALRPLCTLAALTLLIQSLLISPYFLSILAVFLDNCTIKIANGVISTVTKSANAPSPPSKRSYISLFLSFILGEKGTSLYNPSYSLESNILEISTKPEKEFSDCSAWRLKLIIFTSFLLFNFITPLTPFTLSHRPINQSSTTFSNTSLAIADPVATMLNFLPGPGAYNTGKELYIKLYPDLPASTPPPPNSTSLFSSHISISRNRITLSYTLSVDSPILPDQIILSTSLLAMLLLNFLLSGSLWVSQPASAVLDKKFGSLKKFNVVREEVPVGDGPGREGQKE